SELTGLPPRTVEKTHAVLRENGITSGTIGSMGGISLSVPLEKVSLGKLLEIFDNGVQFAACYGDKTNDCPNIPVCPRRGNWKDLSARVQKMLDGVCLAEVLDGHEGIAAAAERRL
ncbi:MAG: Rrf2 family transcriptional regulator, partial [Deltaproteobacteria bacterium]|nr:Rrf2 family transcriptional regulator [Deltaproteobacteria bacterium]